MVADLTPLICAWLKYAALKLGHRDHLYFKVYQGKKNLLGKFYVGVFPLAKALRQNPTEVAKKLQESWENYYWAYPEIKSVEAKGAYLVFSAEPKIN